MLLKDIQNNCMGKKIFIYGAGVIGKRCFSLLNESGIRVEGFIVTKIKDDVVSDDNVVEISNVPLNSEIAVIIAGSIQNSAQMQLELVSRGIRSYYFYDEQIESRVRSTIDFFYNFHEDRVGIYGTGTIATAVIDRLLDKEQIPYVGDEFIVGNNRLYRINSVEDVIKNEVSTVIVADDEMRTDEFFIKRYDELQRLNVVILDAYGKKLTKDLFEAKQLGLDKRKRNALVIDNDIPRFDMNAGARLSFHYMLCLKKLGYSVWLLPLGSASNEYKPKIEAEGIHVVSDMEYGKSWIYVNGHYFDLVFLQRAECSEYYLDCILKYCSSAKLIFHPADLHFLRLERQHEVSGDKRLKEQSEYFKKIECKAIENSDFVYVVGSAEKKIVEELAPGKAVRDIPIYLYDEKAIPGRKPASERKDLIFVGGFGHNPNIDAVKWLAGEILPIVIDKRPDIVCHVVGSKAPEDIIALGSKNLIIEGFVTDEELESLYKNCRLSVAPLRFGAGIKGKVIEAAYYGLPVITTSIGAEGVHEPEKFITVANSAEEFAASILRVYDDLLLIEKVSQQTREVIKNNYTARVAEEILRTDLVC